MDGRMDEWNAECRVVCIIAAGSERKGWDIIGDERESGVGNRERGKKRGRVRGREGGLKVVKLRVTSHEAEASHT
jgi:hypothetical protein